MAALSPPTRVAAPQSVGFHKLSEIDASAPPREGSDFGLGVPASKNDLADAVDGMC